MIRQYNNRTVQVENGVTKYLADIFCNSTDTKPTANLVNGSKLTEVDTGKTFLYDEGGSEWVEYSAGGGGVMKINVTDFTSVTQTYFRGTSDKSFTEIVAVFQTGTPCYVYTDFPGIGTLGRFISVLGYSPTTGNPSSFITIFETTVSGNIVKIKMTMSSEQPYTMYFEMVVD